MNCKSIKLILLSGKPWFLILGLLSFLTAFTQSKVAARYDSLKNFLGEDASLYIGQELYLRPKPMALRHMGYTGFYTDYRQSKATNPVYKKAESGSKYEELEAKIFQVMAVLDQPVQGAKSFYGKKYFLQLKDKMSGDIVYFDYNSELEHQFPFVVVGLVQKLQAATVGQHFIFGSNKLRFGENENDIKTGMPLQFELGEIWEGMEVRLDENDQTPMMLLKDASGQVCAINFEYAFSSTRSRDLYSQKEAEQLQAKFGQEKWKQILQGKVDVGMTKEMAQLSWGKPNEIDEKNSTSRKLERWVYKDNFLYFDNDKVAIIQ